jgi:predicted ATP-binding protein involved in virulence
MRIEMTGNELYCIEKMKFSNFRCFPELTITFDKHLTVLVAPNGGGKTAVLDGIVLTLQPFIKLMEASTLPKTFEMKEIRMIWDKQFMVQIAPAILQVNAVFFGNQIAWKRERNIERATRSIEPLKNFASELLSQHKSSVLNKTDSSVLFPLISYYGTGRLWSESKMPAKLKLRSKTLNVRSDGYTDCLSPSSHYKDFTDWFRRFSYEAKKESADRKESPHNPQSALSAVRHAVNIALAPSGWQNPEWDFVKDCIVANHPKHGNLPVDALSDGIRNMIGLVADIAHRAYRLNPFLKENAAAKTPGIVLIDEVDMHLHPEWQQLVLKSIREAFPKVQFIVTTHSPQVLTTIRKENIRILASDSDGNWTANIPEKSPLAQESNNLL